MGKSFGAKVMSDLLELFEVYMDKNRERLLADALNEGDMPTPPPRSQRPGMKARPTAASSMRMRKALPPGTVFYIHGGACFMDFTRSHWRLPETLVSEADVQVIAPAYRRVPFATYREAFDLIAPLYREYCEAHPKRNIILMGDSAGGGLSLALTEHFKAEGIRLPDRLILLSPWVDGSMDNEQIREYEPVDPFLSVKPLRTCAELWKGDPDVHDWHISPIYGDLKGIRNVTVFVGTDGILYPDIAKCFSLLDDDSSNEPVIGEEMNHVCPLYPIPEAKPAVDKIIRMIQPAGNELWQRHQVFQ